MELRPDGGVMKAFVELLQVLPHYLGILMIAIIASTANYVAKLRRTHKIFSFIELMGDWLISGFSALMVAFLCKHFELDWELTAVACGIAGHMGSRAIGLMEYSLVGALKAKYPHLFRDSEDKND